MHRAIHAFILALGDLPHRRVLRILALSLTLTLVLFAVSATLLYFGLHRLLTAPPWLEGYAVDVAGLLTVLGVFFGSWLLFRAVAIMVIGLFADAIVADVEGHHYPDAARRAVPIGAAHSIALALESLGRLILGNLLALPFYIALLITGIGAPILAFAVNAVLLGRDLEDMVLARHPDLLRLDRTARWSIGALSAATFLVPVANFLAPVLAAAMAVHMVHLQKSDI